MEEVPADEVRAELGRILGSSEFSRAPRHSRFLRFVVEETLAGRGPDIKESVVGVEVFGKTPTFDPKTDSTVRTEASKLRSRLDRYYETAGGPRVVRITVPKGAYAAAFEAQARPEPATGTASQRRRLGIWWVAAVLATAGAAVAIMDFPQRLALGKPTRVVPLSNMPGMELYPRFSPDGKRVAFSWVSDPDRLSVYIRDLGGSSPVRLTNHPSFDRYPVWSPDGQTLAFFRESANPALMLIGDSPREERILTETGNVTSLSWSPDNRYLAVAERPAPNQPSVIYLISLPSAIRKQLTFPPARSQGDLACSFSPDGRRIAFVRYEPEGAYSVQVMPVSGGEATVVVKDHYRIMGLDWLPGGRDLVFAWEHDSERRLWRVPTGGWMRGAPTRLEGLDEDSRNPAVWRGPPGAPVRLAFETRGGDTDLFEERLIDGRLDGKPVAFAPSSAMEQAPRFSPDGSLVAFLSSRTGRQQIWLASPGGGELRQMTDFPETVKALRQPRWSPASSEVAVSGFEDGLWRILIVPLRGGQPHGWMRENAQQYAPNWSVDGKWMYFSSDRSGTTEVWKAPISGGPPVRITHHGGDNPEESMDGSRVFFAAGARNVGLWSMPAAGGIEALFHANIDSDWWQVTSQGIYYVDYSRKPTALKLLSVDGATTRHLGDIPELPVTFKPGMTISPDGSRMVYSRPVYSLADLVLAEYAR